jgi:hypothetical protein
MTPDADSAAKAVDMLDLLLEFFEGGKYWMKYDFIDDEENRCLIGAMRFIRTAHNLHGAPARHYLLRAMTPLDRRWGLMWFNDGCRRFAEIAALIRKARQLAVADIEQQRNCPFRRRLRYDASKPFSPLCSNNPTLIEPIVAA